MSIEDGLVMQLHVGSERNHNPRLHARFGPDRGPTSPSRPSGRAASVPCWPITATTRACGSSSSRWTRAPTRASSPRSPGTTRRSTWRAVVVPRQPGGDPPLPRPGHRDRGLLQPGRLQRRHARLRVHPGAPRPVAARDVRLAGRKALRGLLDQDDAVVMAGEPAHGLARRAYRLDEPRRPLPSSGWSWAATRTCPPCARRPRRSRSSASRTK